MKGAQVFASYTKQAIADYAGNPLIEALPPIFSEEVAMQLISNFPVLLIQKSSPSTDRLGFTASTD